MAFGRRRRWNIRMAIPLHKHSKVADSVPFVTVFALHTGQAGESIPGMVAHRNDRLE